MVNVVHEHNVDTCIIDGTCRFLNYLICQRQGMVLHARAAPKIAQHHHPRCAPCLGHIRLLLP